MAVAALLAIVLAACGGDEFATTGEDCPHCGDWGFEDGEQVIRDMKTCGPRAVGRTTDDVPTIPDEVEIAQCGLIAERVERDFSQREVHWSHDGRVLSRFEHVDGELRNAVDFEFDAELAEVLRVEKQDILFNYYSLPRERGVRIQNWSFDDEGRLLEYQSQTWEYEEDELELRRTQRAEQTWGGAGLESLVTEYDGDGVSHKSVKQWSYDDGGRLIEAVLQNDEEITDRIAYSYEEGMLTGMKRYGDGREVESHRWKYEEGMLVQRQIRIRDWRQPAVLDSVTEELRSSSVLYGYANTSPPTTPWRSANAHMRSDGECTEVPVSHGHGYPLDEKSYHVGFGSDDSHNRAVISAHSDEHYGYVGTPWYGHLGVSSGWAVMYSNRISDLDIVVTYDEQGRMVEEVLGYKPRQGEEWVDVTRRRGFGKEGMKSDALTVSRGGRQARAELTFLRDERGALVERQRLRNGDAVSAQRWSYDADGVPVRLQIDGAVAERSEGSAADYYTYAGVREMPDALIGRTSEKPELAATFERGYDHLGRLTFETTRPHRDDIPAESLHRVYGDHGKTDEFYRRDSAPAGGSHDVWEYDERGLLVFEATDYGLDGNFDRSATFVRDDEGRVIEEITETPYGVRRVLREFGCH